MTDSSRQRHRYTYWKTFSKSHSSSPARSFRSSRHHIRISNASIASEGTMSKNWHLMDARKMSKKRAWCHNHEWKNEISEEEVHQRMTIDDSTCVILWCSIHYDLQQYRSVTWKGTNCILLTDTSIRWVSLFSIVYFETKSATNCTISTSVLSVNPNISFICRNEKFTW